MVVDVRGLSCHYTGDPHEVSLNGCWAHKLNRPKDSFQGTLTETAVHEPPLLDTAGHVNKHLCRIHPDIEQNSPIPIRPHLVPQKPINFCAVSLSLLGTPYRVALRFAPLLGTDRSSETSLCTTDLRPDA